MNHKNDAQMNNEMEYVFEQEKYKTVDTVWFQLCVCVCVCEYMHKENLEKDNADMLKVVISESWDSKWFLKKFIYFWLN